MPCPRLPLHLNSSLHPLQKQFGNAYQKADFLEIQLKYANQNAQFLGMQFGNANLTPENAKIVNLVPLSG